MSAGLMCCIGTCHKCDEIRRLQDAARCPNRALSAREAWRLINARNGNPHERWLFPQDGWLILVLLSDIVAGLLLGMGVVAAIQQRRAEFALAGLLLCCWFAFIGSMCVRNRRQALRAPSAGGRQP